MAFLTRKFVCGLIQTYAANFSRGRSILPWCGKLFRETGQVLSHHSTFLWYRNRGDFFEKVLSTTATPNRKMIPANIIWEAVMKSLVVKRSVILDGHKTSVSLEDAFWSDLKEIAYMQRATLSKVITGISRA